MFDKKRVHRHWLPPAALGSLEREFPWLRLPTALWVFKRCWKNASQPLGTVQWWERKRWSPFYIFLSQSGWCFHNVDIYIIYYILLYYISMWRLLQNAWVMPVRMCKMIVLTAAQHWCIKSMPKMAHAPEQVRTPEEQFLKTHVCSRWFDPASFQLPSLPLRLWCSVDLSFWEFQSRSEHLHLPSEIKKPGKRGPGLRSLQWHDVNCTLHETTFQHSRLTISSKSRNERAPCNGCGATANPPSSWLQLKQWPHSRAGGPSGMCILCHKIHMSFGAKTIIIYKWSGTLFDWNVAENVNSDDI